MRSDYGRFSGITFSGVFKSFELFKEEWEKCPFYNRYKDELNDVVEETFYMLYSDFGNSTIRSSDINRFKIKLFEIFIIYGPTWKKKVEIQKKLRGLSEDDLMIGSSEIYNHAQNPASLDASTGELPYIDRQTSTKRKRSFLDAYMRLSEELSTNHTEAFLRQFKKLFTQIVLPDEELYYEDIT